jgi:hypothetical protein
LMTLTTQNVTRICLHHLNGAKKNVTIDGQAMGHSETRHFHRLQGQWHPGEGPDGLRKKHGLQGPIDDAFMDRFIIVLPTGKSKNPLLQKWVEAQSSWAIASWRRVFRGDAIIRYDTEVTPEDIKSANLVLWGEPASNAVLGKIADRLPLKFDPMMPNVVPVFIYPNPLNPNRYVVINSGITMREYDQLNNARQVPKLPDWAKVDITMPANSRTPGKILDAGFFDEAWQLKANPN